MAVNLSTLRLALRYRLNDYDEGGYSDAELLQCLNTAYRDSVIAGRTFNYAYSSLVTNENPFYDISPIFEPLIVTIAIGGVGVAELEKTTYEDLHRNNPLSAWATATQPTKWYRRGSTSAKGIAIYPSPRGIDPTLRLYVGGCASPTDLADAADAPDALPAGFDESALLDRAEAEARKFRLTFGANAQVYSVLMESWKVWVAMMKEFHKTGG